MHRILALDDDFIILKLIETAFKSEDVALKTFSEGEEALSALERESFDLVITDLVMPRMDGDEFLKRAKRIKRDIPFLFLTAHDDRETAVKIMKMGADEYICKPVQGKTIVEVAFRVIEEKRKELLIAKTLQDDQMDKQDQQGIFSWKNLYGSKDTQQADRMMGFLSRNIDQAGGFMWLNMLKDKLALENGDAQEITLNRGMVDLIIESTDYISKILEDLSYVTALQEQTLLLEPTNLGEALIEFKHIFENEMIQTAAAYDRKVSLDISSGSMELMLEINQDGLLSIMRELLFNCIKYSPQHSKIMIRVDIRKSTRDNHLEISFWNKPVDIIPENQDGEKITGIPYEFSESVFELFYTIDKFPKRIPEEQWSQGTGLYIVRKLLQKMNGNIQAGNIVMHTPGESLLFVKTTLYLPLFD